MVLLKLYVVQLPKKLSEILFDSTRYWTVKSEMANLKKDEIPTVTNYVTDFLMQSSHLLLWKEILNLFD